jgi:hypothetical protein
MSFSFQVKKDNDASVAHTHAFGRFSSSKFNAVQELPPKPTFQQVVEKAIEVQRHHNANSIRGFIANELDHVHIPQFQTSKDRAINEHLRSDSSKQGMMFHPSSNFISMWTCASIVLLAYIALTVPVSVYIHINI